MKEIVVDVVYAFTKDGQGGNAAGVLLDASALTAPQMQDIAAQTNYSETVFFCPPKEGADHTVRFFAPLKEVPLCGHGTIAGYAQQFHQGKLTAGAYTMWTQAGVQDITVSEDGLIGMSQNRPTFGATLSPKEIGPLLGISADDFASDIPIQIVSTGLNKILAPIRSLSAIQSIQPDLEAIKTLSHQHNVTGIYTFTLESETGATAHCRNFAPAVGISEDAATGTSCAALSCLLYTYDQLAPHALTDLSFEQGYEIGEPSELLASLEVSNGDIVGVRVMGRATQRGERRIQLTQETNGEPS
tara:strand:- start:3683 stop:4585 length:903 start_codon:yes stop_codon:yes gene_type:complete